MKKLFAALSKVHQELDRIFDSHQRALFAGDVDLALASLARFGSILEDHIDFEEHRVLPLYADQGPANAGASLEILQAEHRKLRESTENLIRRTELLFGAADLPGATLALLDDETAFKGVFHHHAAREEKLLFPRLDARTTDEERDAWLSGS